MGDSFWHALSVQDPPLPTASPSCSTLPCLAFLSILTTLASNRRIHNMDWKALAFLLSVPGFSVHCWKELYNCFTASPSLGLAFNFRPESIRLGISTCMDLRRSKTCTPKKCSLQFVLSKQQFVSQPGHSKGCNGTVTPVRLAKDSTGSLLFLYYINNIQKCAPNRKTIIVLYNCEEIPRESYLQDCEDSEICLLISLASKQR